MGERGPTAKRKPDQEWARDELARLERDAAHFRELALPEYFEPLVARAAEFREALATRDKSKSWRTDKPWEAWTQRQQGILHAQTIDPTEARHLALRVAVGRVLLLLAAGTTEDSGPDSEVYKMAELACADAADTLGNQRSTVPLERALQLARKRVERGDVPERLERVRDWRERAPSLLVVEFLTGASLDTLLRLFP